MKTSELIALLQAAIAQHGDIKCVANNSDGDWEDIGSIDVDEFWPKTASEGLRVYFHAESDPV